MANELVQVVSWGSNTSNLLFHDMLFLSYNCSLVYNAFSMVQFPHTIINIYRFLLLFVHILIGSCAYYSIWEL
jgi:uncharacterized membrane protein YesL